MSDHFTLRYARAYGVLLSASQIASSYLDMGMVGLALSALESGMLRAEEVMAGRDPYEGKAEEPKEKPA